MNHELRPRNKSTNEALVSFFCLKMSREGSDNEENEYEAEEDIEDDLDDTGNNKRFRSIDEFALDEDEDDNDKKRQEIARPRFATSSSTITELAPYQPSVPNRNPNAVRPEYATIDAVAYYDQTALWSLMYMKVTQGIPIPSVFDAQKQKM